MVKIKHLKINIWICFAIMTERKNDGNFLKLTKNVSCFLQYSQLRMSGIAEEGLTLQLKPVIHSLFCHEAV